MIDRLARCHCAVFVQLFATVPNLPCRRRSFASAPSEQSCAGISSTVWSEFTLAIHHPYQSHTRAHCLSNSGGASAYSGCFLAQLRSPCSICSSSLTLWVRFCEGTFSAEIRPQLYRFLQSGYSSIWRQSLCFGAHSKASSRYLCSIYSFAFGLSIGFCARISWAWLNWWECPGPRIGCLSARSLPWWSPAILLLTSHFVILLSHFGLSAS